MVQLAVFMSTFEISVINLALPIIQQDFGVSLSDIKWVAVVYSATNAIALPVAAFLGRRLGIVPVYRFGQIFFVIATISCGFAGDLDTLISLRFISGVGASFILALNNVILLAIFPRHQHGLALGITGSTFSLGILCGLAAGGVLSERFGWQSVFFVNLLPALPMLIMSFVFLRSDIIDIRKEQLSFDWLGLGLAVAALGTTMYALGPLLKTNEHFGFGNLMLITATVLLIVLWLRHEFVSRDSFLNLHLLKIAPLSFNFSNGILVRSSMGAVNFIIPFYLQSSLLLSPFTASIILSTGAIAMGIFGPFAGRFLDRYGALQTMRISLLLMAMGVMCYVLLPTKISGEQAIRTVVIWVIGAQFLIGAGSVFFSGAVTYGSMRATPKENWGVVSGLQSVNLMVGTALGASIAANLVGSWGQGEATTAVIPEGALFALFGAITLLLLGLGIVSWCKNRNAYDALLDKDEEPSRFPARAGKIKLRLE